MKTLMDALLERLEFDPSNASLDEIRSVAAELRHLRAGVKALASTHGVRGATGSRQPTIEETTEHINRVVRELVARAYQP